MGDVLQLQGKWRKKVNGENERVMRGRGMSEGRFGRFGQEGNPSGTPLLFKGMTDGAWFLCDSVAIFYSSTKIGAETHD